MKKRLLAKKVTAIAATTAMAVSMLAGCGSSKTETTAAATQAAAETKAAETEAAKEESAEPVTIKFQYWADNTDYSALMQDIIKKFNDENGKGITVVGEEQPWDGGAYAENLFNAKMGGSDVDVSTWKLTSTPLFANNDLLLDLTPYVDAMDTKADIDDNIYSVMREAGGDDTKSMFTIDHLFLRRPELLMFRRLMKSSLRM